MFFAWDSGVVGVEGTIAPGETIKVTSAANPKRAFPVTVTEFEPRRSMTWSGGMPLGLFKGGAYVPARARARRHEVHDAGGVHRAAAARDLEVDADLGPSFEQFARGLKQEAESSA